MQAATLTPLARGRRMLTTDEQLVAAVRRGDDRAFETLYHRYHRRIAAYVVGMVKDHGRAEDVTQEIFLNALRRMRATDRDIVFKPWLYEIARNACIDQFRRTRRTDEVSYDAAEDGGAVTPLVSGGPGPAEAAESRKQLDDLCGAFGGLSESHHQILVLRELEGRSYQEIGERLQLSRPAVESTLFRARKRLGEEYDELVSGERCRRVQALVATAGEGSLGVRDRRTLARHVSHCQPCRRAAAMAGLVPGRTGVRGKIAALLPLPAFLRDRWLGMGAPGSATGDGGRSLVSWVHAAAPMADNASGWGKAAAAAIAVAIAGVGAGRVATRGDADDTSRPPAPIAAAAGTGAVTRPAAATAAAAHVTSTAGAHVSADRRTTSRRRSVAQTGAGGVGARGRAVTTTAAPSSSSGAGPSGGPTEAPDPVRSLAADSSTGTVKTTTSAATTVPSAPSVGDTGATVPPSGVVSETVDTTTKAVDGVVAETTSTVQGVVADTTQTVQAVVDGTAPALSGVVAGTTETVKTVVDETTSTVNGVVGGTTSGVRGIVAGLGKPSSSGG